jgi:hypothetical protein
MLSLTIVNCSHEPALTPSWCPHPPLLIPAPKRRELEPGGRVKRVEILGERLIAYRTPAGSRA